MFGFLFFIWTQHHYGGLLQNLFLPVFPFPSSKCSCDKKKMNRFVCVQKRIKIVIFRNTVQPFLFFWPFIIAGAWHLGWIYEHDKTKKWKPNGELLVIDEPQSTKLRTKSLLILNNVLSWDAIAKDAIWFWGRHQGWVGSWKPFWILKSRNWSLSLAYEMKEQPEISQQIIIIDEKC